MNGVPLDLNNNRFNPILWLCDSVVGADKNGVMNGNDGFLFVLPKHFELSRMPIVSHDTALCRPDKVRCGAPQK